jgi:hypothetical protein
MPLWMLQWYAYVPAWVGAVKVVVFPELTCLVSNDFLSSEVTVCAVLSAFATVTVDPALTVIGLGEKSKFLMVIALPTAGGVVAGGVVATDDEADEDEDDDEDLLDDPPQLASTRVKGTATARTTRGGRMAVIVARLELLCPVRHV